jgi:hypothetical protein
MLQSLISWSRRQHHRPVAGDQRGKRRLVAAGGEILQELVVGPGQRLLACRELADVTQE